MKKLKWHIPAIVFIGVFQVASCTKTVDTTKSSLSLETSDNLTFPTTNEFSNCKLRRIYQSYGEGNATVTGLFTYNGQGNPVSVLFNETFTASHYFSYDSKARLKQYRTTSEFGTGTRDYGYDKNNRIITDTSTWRSGSVLQIDIITLTYDSLDRIIKENIRNIQNLDIYGHLQPLKATRNPTYTYDSRGNLAVAGWKSSSYDYKVSIFRAHPVFQFIHRNYSRNNSSVQTRYNSKGLPLSVIPGNDNFFNLYNVTKAIYDCQ
jgi:hypothetical protein